MTPPPGHGTLHRTPLDDTMPPMPFKAAPTRIRRLGDGYAATVHLPLVPVLLTNPERDLESIHWSVQANMRDFIVSDPAQLLAGGLEQLAGLGELLGFTVETADIIPADSPEARGVPRHYSVLEADVWFPGSPAEAVRGAQDLRQLWHEITTHDADQFREFLDRLEELRQRLQAQEARKRVSQQRTLNPW